ncbi:hypothetical protein B9Z51_12210 [Limnohabitans sp. T6-5]|uniref:ribosomal maturation YjgA family protein n=1 Tax=Limnohabitans sp. T6-5 TaxID=1100724 RepID=UPI000D397A12|nr:DUF2809 domain-containing protein [Limnohabitans sp. T6-5]PUE06708.1 hypothetical protein B9Z51_12210 [Limnohabitans sp. T6-5]
MCRNESTSRSRWVSLAGIGMVIALGLASRRYGQHWPYGLNNHPGDALWALMMFGVWSLFRPVATTAFLAQASLLTCYLVEFSQRVQAPWLNAIRHTVWGRLVLGASFSWTDLAAYTVGVAVGVLLDRWRTGQKNRIAF